METKQPSDSPPQHQRTKGECPFGHSEFFQAIAQPEERLVMPRIVAAVANGRLPYKLEPKQELMGILSRVISRQWEEASRIRRENPECSGLMMRDFFGAGGYLSQRRLN